MIAIAASVLLVGTSYVLMRRAPPTPARPIATASAAAAQENRPPSPRPQPAPPPEPAQRPGPAPDAGLSALATLTRDAPNVDKPIVDHPQAAPVASLDTTAPTADRPGHDGGAASAEAPPPPAAPSTSERSSALESPATSATPAPPPTVRYPSRPMLYALQLPAAKTGKGVLSITADPFGERVYVNGVPYGSTPLEILVPAGRYNVRVTNSRWGERTKTVAVSSGKRSLWIAALSKK